VESNLYAPVKAFLEARGYLVRAEVQHCDVAALRTREDGGEELLVVELKQGLTIDLLLQGVKRQKAADLVYLAVPRPKRFWFEARWRDIMHLLRRLELGLLLVVPDGVESGSKGKTVKQGQAPVEVVLEPKPFDRAQSVSRAKRVRKAMVNEARERSGDYNVGGSTRQAIVTVYRERALNLVSLIEKSGAGYMSIAGLKKAGAHAESASHILQSNVYGWFVRTGRGYYGLSAAGKLALEEFATVVQKGQQS